MNILHGDDMSNEYFDKELLHFYNEKPCKAPNIFLIGAMRSGSTTLHNLLGQHPDIYMSDIKEPMFFVAEAMRENIAKSKCQDRKGIERKLSVFVEKGKFRQVAQYKKLFESAAEYSWRGESSHYLYHPNTAAIIHRYIPNAKVIITIRNPVDRLHSEYLLLCRTGVEKRSFSDFVMEGCNFDLNGKFIEAKNRVNKGFYTNLIKPWIALFGESQVKIITYDDFSKNSTIVAQSIYKWLNIDDDFKPRSIHSQRSGIPKSTMIGQLLEYDNIIKRTLKKILSKKIRNRITDIAYRTLLVRDDIDPCVRKILLDIYIPDIEALEILVKLDLESWKA